MSHIRRRAGAPLYDRIGDDYRGVRLPDPRLAAAIWAALGDAASVLNVGAGTGSYEPTDRPVIAVEPSRAMIAQRRPDSAPVIEARAEELPLEDNAVDAALAVFSLHHWNEIERGLNELLRVAARRIVLVTMDIEAYARLWIVREYVPEVLRTHAASFPEIEWLLRALPGSSVSAVPVPRDCTDGFMAAFWARPEAYLDPGIRQGTSVWHQLPVAVVERALRRLREDLASGHWDERHGHLRRKPSLDVGLRVLVSELQKPLPSARSGASTSVRDGAETS